MPGPHQAIASNPCPTLLTQTGEGRSLAHQPSQEQAPDRLKVSVILPIRNEARFIEDCLGALFRQDYDAELLEVIVVDGMSDDGTRDLLKAATSTNQRIKVIDNPKRIFPTGANLGIAQARGDLILILGGHAMLPQNYIRECVKCLLEADVDCVGGAMDSIGVGYVAQGIAVAMSSRYGVGGSGFRTQGPKHVPVPTDTVPFGVFRRKVFERIGLFNESMVRHQDYELNYRLREAGGKMLLLPWLRVRYHVRSGLNALRRQYWQYGFWKGRFLRTYPASARFRHLVPPLFLLSVTISVLLALVVPMVGAVCLSTLVAAYAGFVLLATLWLAGQGHLKHAPLIPLILLSLHLIWGAGVWAGLLAGKISGKPVRLADIAAANLEVT